MRVARTEPSRFQRIGIVADGAPGVLLRQDTLRPMIPDVIAVEAWTSGTAEPEGLLGWLGRTFHKRPLLGLSVRPLRDVDGTWLRGLASLGSGVALVSSAGLSQRALVGVVRHEVAHALGLGHCDQWACALARRPHPLDVEARPEVLCPRCQTLWESRCVGASR